MPEEYAMFPAHRTAAVVLAAVACLAFVTPSQVSAAPPTDSYAAIAVSDQTGHYAFSSGCASQREAALAACLNCGTADARVVTWVKNGWVALAIGETGNYYSAWSTRSANDAGSRALLGTSRFGGRSQLAAVTASR
jgi:hypothetical protein